jgi:hypothetical protein
VLTNNSTSAILLATWPRREVREVPDKNVYDLSPGKDGWGVERRGAQRASGRFDTKQEAVQRGRELADARGGRLVIRKQDGTIQEERTYRKDPYPPQG